MQTALIKTNILFDIEDQKITLNISRRKKNKMTKNKLNLTSIDGSNRDGVQTETR